MKKPAKNKKVLKLQNKRKLANGASKHIQKNQRASKSFTKPRNSNQAVKTSSKSKVGNKTMQEIKTNDKSIVLSQNSPIDEKQLNSGENAEIYKNFFEIINHFGGNKPLNLSEKIEEQISKQVSQKFKSTWKGHVRSQTQSGTITDSIGLEIPIQPKTRTINREDQEREQKKETSGSKLKSKTFINCDLRFFNLKYLVDQIGHFEVVHIDPPWRIKGAQRNNSSFMFSNNKFNLEYSTMSNQEIINIPVETLATKGFCFLWILNSQMHIGYECMNKWGYEVVDQLTWIKTKNNKVHISHGFYFLHSSETCLVGYKCQPNQYVQFNSKISNNLLVAEIRKKSQKPDQIYTLIDLLLPTANKIELFARNNNLREGWLSLGNQLGENYLNREISKSCDSCKSEISVGTKRFKSKITANLDICEDCASNKKAENFYILENSTDEDILHEYLKCNICQAEPIWGPRFKCSTCPDMDICESCFDARLLKLNLKNTKSKNGKGKSAQKSAVNELIATAETFCPDHQFSCIELPLLANGLAAHNDYKCVSCYMRPIIGGCFVCADCVHFSMCQNCYFTRQDDQSKLKIRGHNHETHRIELIVEPRQKIRKYVKCHGCQMNPISGVRYKCENCFDFDLCEKCYVLYAIDKKELKTTYSTSHKQYHTFTRLQLQTSDKPKLSNQVTRVLPNALAANGHSNGAPPKQSSEHKEKESVKQNGNGTDLKKRGRPKKNGLKSNKKTELVEISINLDQMSGDEEAHN